MDGIPLSGTIVGQIGQDHSLYPATVTWANGMVVLTDETRDAMWTWLDERCADGFERTYFIPEGAEKGTLVYWCEEDGEWYIDLDDLVDERQFVIIKR